MNPDSNTLRPNRWTRREYLIAFGGNCQVTEGTACLDLPSVDTRVVGMFEAWNDSPEHIQVAVSTLSSGEQQIWPRCWSYTKVSQPRNTVPTFSTCRRGECSQREKTRSLFACSRSSTCMLNQDRLEYSKLQVVVLVFN